MLSRRVYHLGLTGWPLGHSLSPALHAAALHALEIDGEYRLYPVRPGDTAGLAALLEALRTGALDGLNVTIPHKQAMVAGVDRLTPLAQAIGAVNTIYRDGGQLVGDNTDAPGFALGLTRFIEGLPGTGSDERHALVLGAGGAARAAVYALAQAGWQVAVAARRVEAAQVLAQAVASSLTAGGITSLPLEPGALGRLAEAHPPRLVVNATPLGMDPDVDRSPWPAGLAFPAGAAVYDLVYRPRETKLLRAARAAGLPVCGGIGMLVEQAALAFERWTGQPALRAPMYAAVGEPLPIAQLSMEEPS